MLIGVVVRVQRVVRGPCISANAIPGGSRGGEVRCAVQVDTANDHEVLIIGFHEDRLVISALRRKHCIVTDTRLVRQAASLIDPRSVRSRAVPCHVRVLPDLMSVDLVGPVCAVCSLNQKIDRVLIGWSHANDDA